MTHGYPDYEGGKQGLLEQSQLAEKEGNYFVLTAVGNNKAYLESAAELYDVLTGNTLYITTLTALIYATLVGNADLNQMCYIEVYAPSVATLQVQFTLNGGGVIVLKQPIKVSAGGRLIIYIYNVANHNCEIALTARGYEI